MGIGRPRRAATSSATPLFEHPRVRGTQKLKAPCAPRTSFGRGRNDASASACWKSSSSAALPSSLAGRSTAAVTSATGASVSTRRIVSAEDERDGLRREKEVLRSAAFATRRPPTGRREPAVADARKVDRESVVLSASRENAPSGRAAAEERDPAVSRASCVSGATKATSPSSSARRPVSPAAW